MLRPPSPITAKIFELKIKHKNVIKLKFPVKVLCRHAQQ
jgi:hypothetical protein